MDMQDWIIMRLMRTAVKRDHKFGHTRDFMKTATYLMDKYGKTIFFNAIKELEREEEQKEAQRKAAQAQPPCTCAHCQSEAQLRQARGWRSAGEVAAPR